MVRSAIIAILLLLSMVGTALGQTPLVTKYTFGAAAGTFTALSSGNTMALSGGNLDDGYYNNVPLSFDFWYMGVRYRALHASTNGWITWGSALASSPYVNNLNSGVPRPVVAPLWDDLALPVAFNFSWQESGTAPNRVMTLQWLNCYWHYLATTSSISLQVRLFETSGRVEFVYRQESGTVVSASASIGITAAGTGSGNYRSLSSTSASPTVSSTTETATLSSRPSNGRTYSWTPPVPAAPSTLTFTNVSATGMTLNWIDNATNEVGYVIYQSTDGVNYSFLEQVAANSTQAVETGLSPYMLYYWRVYAVTEGALSNPLSGQRMTDCAGVPLSQVPTSGWLGYYRLAGNGLDETGLNPGTLQGSPLAVADRFGVAGKAINLQGATQYLSTVTSSSAPAAFSLSLWFRGERPGRLLGMGAQSTGSSASTDRQLYLDDAGRVCFGLLSGTARMVQSPASYVDSSWHHVVGTLSPTAGMELYVDGQVVATNPLVTTASSYTGYWRIGEDNLAGWPAQPSTAYSGDVDEALIYDHALTPTEVETLHERPDGAGNDGPVCAGSTLGLTATTVAGATYQWAGPNGFSSTQQNPSLVYTTATNGTYTVVATLGGCTATAHTIVTGSPEPGRWTGAVSSDWNTSSNWCGGVVPSTTTDVTVPAGVPNMPLLSATGYCHHLTIAVGAQVITGANGILSVSGDLQNLGNMTNSGLTNFNGSGGLQTVSGVGFFNDLSLTNGAEVALAQAILVGGDLSIVAGTLVTNGQSIEVAGDWRNTGAFVAGTGAVKFSSSTAATVTQSGTGAFFRMILDKPGSNLTLQSPVTVTHHLALTSGILNLGGEELSITRADTSALTRVNGLLLSEQVDNSSVLSWTIGTQPGRFSFPFGTLTGSYVPLVVDHAAGDLGVFSVATYGTIPSNQPYPQTPELVTNLFGANGQDNSQNAVDRFWQVEATGSTGTATLSFTAQPSETVGIPVAYAQRYDSLSDTWNAALPGQIPLLNGVQVPSVSQFGVFALTNSSVPFPVEFIGFEAYPRYQDVVVKWVTAMETNSDLFEVRRSVDGAAFHRLGVVDAAGNSRSRRDYQYVDTLPLLGRSYYQVKEVDQDGASLSTEVAEVYYDPSLGVKVVVYPNPTTEERIHVQLLKAGGQQALVKLADMNGRVLLEELVNVESDPYEVELHPVQSLARGMYVLQVRYRGGEHSAILEIR